MVLHYITELKNINTHSWFPITSIYSNNSRIELFERMKSIRFFEKTKCLFDVQNVKQIRNLILEYAEKKKGFPGHFPGSEFEIQPLEYVINSNKIGTEK